MDNHYHLVVETIGGNLSKGMWQLNGVYTQKLIIKIIELVMYTKDGIKQY
jgi:hypothetical protein